MVGDRTTWRPTGLSPHAGRWADDGVRPAREGSGLDVDERVGQVAAVRPAREGSGSQAGEVPEAPCTGDAAAVADQVAACVLGQVHRAYPCASSQVLMSADQPLSRPRDTFCAFYGSFDWHSCVHSHWTLARLLAEGLLHPDRAAQAVAALDRTFDAPTVAREAANWERLPVHTELPYGMTWLLVLDAELARPVLTAAHPGWRSALAPLADLAAGRVRAWVAGLRLPVRSGVHSDTAWSLAMAHDWAAAVGDAGLRAEVVDRARALYLRDVDAPCAYEPSGQTFTSPILNEAALMARVLSAGEYDAWMRGYLPRLFEPDAAERPAFADGLASAGAADFATADPAAVPLLPDVPAAWDGADYFGVHEVALPLARCIAARDAASALVDPAARTRLRAEARRWASQGLDALDLRGYLADHWVGSFAAAVVAPAGTVGA